MKGSEEEGQKGLGIGERFQEETKYTAGRMGYALDWQNMPEPHKNYASPIATIALPEPLIGQAGKRVGGFRQAKVDAGLFPGAEPTSRPLVVPALVHPGHYRHRRRVVFQGRPLGRGALPHRDLHPRKGRRGARTRHIPLQTPHVRPGVHQERRFCHAAGRCRPWTGHDPGGSGNVHMDGHCREEHVEIPAKGLPVHLHGCRSHCGRTCILPGLRPASASAPWVPSLMTR